MRSFRSFALSAVVAFSVIAVSIQPAHAILPALVFRYVAAEAATITASSIVTTVVASQAANAPYYRAVATVPLSNFPKAMRAAGRVGINPYLAAAMLAAGIYFEGDKFKKQEKQFDYLYKCIYGGVYWVGGGFAGMKACPGVETKSFNVGTADINVSTNVALPNTNKVVPGNIFIVNYTASDSMGNIGNYNYQVVRTAEPVDFGTVVKEITDEQVAHEIAVRLAADNRPDALFTDVAGNVMPELFDNAQIVGAPGVTPDMAAQMQQYRDGLLQTTNPLAAYYVTPERYEEIKKAVAAQDAANSVDGQIDALNEKMKQPITQAQFEESNKKFSDAVNSVTDSVSSKNDFSDIDDHFKKLDDFVTDIPKTSLPSAASVNFPKYSSCRQLHLTDGKGHELAFPSESQCSKLEDIKQGFGYFLYVLCAFGLVWQLLTRPTGG